MELTTATFATSETDHRRDRLASEVRDRALTRRVLASRRRAATATKAAKAASTARWLRAA